MHLIKDIKAIAALMKGSLSGVSPEERMENLYGVQAQHYDGFRERFLVGNEKLMAEIQPKPDQVWVDFGAGTGRNLEFQKSKLTNYKKIFLVDLSPSLLNVAKAKIEKNQWSNVELVQANMQSYQPKEKVDLVTFSYCLSMVDDWPQAILNACEMLNEGGRIAISDFYLARRFSIEGTPSTPFFKREFWRYFFMGDNVVPNVDHLLLCQGLFQEEYLEFFDAKMPFIPGTFCPHYIYVGTKK
jgi:S-adenosylmethionine-diacylgycerolhomoserine-N-methlytransferase